VNGPLVVGWSLGNEFDEIVTAPETSGMLQKPADAAAKQALVDDALTNLYGASVPALAAAWKVAATRVEEGPAAAPSWITRNRNFYHSAI
jgi:hypothetical protein